MASLRGIGENLRGRVPGVKRGKVPETAPTPAGGPAAPASPTEGQTFASDIAGVQQLTGDAEVTMGAILSPGANNWKPGGDTDYERFTRPGRAPSAEPSAVADMGTAAVVDAQQRVAAGEAKPPAATISPADPAPSYLSHDGNTGSTPADVESAAPVTPATNDAGEGTPPIRPEPPSATAPEPEGAGGLTQEAQDLLLKADSGALGTPSSGMNANFLRILDENGIFGHNMTFDQGVSALRAKAARQSVSASPPGNSDPIPDLNPSEGVRPSDPSVSEPAAAPRAEPGYVVDRATGKVTGSLTGNPDDERVISPGTPPPPSPRLGPTGDSRFLDGAEGPTPFGATDLPVTATRTGHTETTVNRPLSEQTPSAGAPDGGRGKKPEGTQTKRTETREAEELARRIKSGENRAEVLKETPLHLRHKVDDVLSGKTTDANSGRGSGEGEEPLDENPLSNNGLSEAARKELELLEMFGRMSPKQLHNRIRALESNINTAELQSSRLTDLNDMAVIQQRIDALGAQKELLQEILEVKGGYTESVQANNSSGAVNHEQFTAMAEKRAKDIAELYKLDSDGLTNKGNELEAQIAVLREGLTGLNASSAEYKALKSQADHLERVKSKVDELKPTHEELKKKKDADDTEAELKAGKKRTDEAWRKHASPRDLNERIGGQRNILNRHDEEIFNLSRELENTATRPERKAEIRKRIVELQNKVLEGEESLALDREALKAAQERVRDEDDGNITRENVRRVSNGEYLKMTKAERAKYLIEIGETLGPLNFGEFDELKSRVLNGESLSVDDRAKLARAYSQQFAEHGRKGLILGRHGVDMKEFNLMAARCPEAAQAAINAVLENDGVNAIGEKRFGPGGWDKVKGFARNHPGWLAILLLAIVGTAGAIAGPGAITGAIGLGAAKA